MLLGFLISIPGDIFLELTPRKHFIIGTALFTVMHFVCSNFVTCYCQFFFALVMISNALFLLFLSVNQTIVYFDSRLGFPYMNCIINV